MPKNTGKVYRKAPSFVEIVMTDRPGNSSTRKVQSLDKWESVFKEIEQNEICGLNLTMTGPDPLSHEIRIISLALPLIFSEKTAV
jgi:hypothetical protein